VVWPQHVGFGTADARGCCAARLMHAHSCTAGWICLALRILGIWSS
jgi:hypothetical protein